MKLHSIVMLIGSLMLLLSGCGGEPFDLNSASKLVEAPAALSTVKVNQLSVTDVNGAPLKNAGVSVQSAAVQSAALAAVTNAAASTDENGYVTIDSLGAGVYSVTVTYGGYTKTVTLKISDQNYQAKASIMVPLSVQGDGSVSEINSAVIASVSGTVTDKDGTPLANVQVSVSGGAATNGAFATAISDQNGAYSVLVNAANDFADALHSATITAQISDYEAQSQTIDISNGVNQAGVNFFLWSSSAITYIYKEDFESASASQWTVNQLSGQNENNTWHIHTSNVTGINTAVTNGLVKLAPNDTSNGMIPAPKGGKCFWYGNGAAGDPTFGSFLDISNSSNNSYDGGSGSYNGGELISPVIDLSGATGDIYLTFDTFWEIESVNPNAGGFDLMTISVSSDGGSTWRDLARLNPLSDPASALDRSPIPFSNTGFNSAPGWLAQEGIPLVNANGTTLSGSHIQLKFTFQTIDGLYNGFRGWMIDNVAIAKGAGTFPLLQGMVQYDIMLSTELPQRTHL